MGHGDMASLAFTDIHMSMEDTPTTTESAMLRPSLTHGDMASVASTDTQMSTQESTEVTLTTTESAKLMLTPTNSSEVSCQTTVDITAKRLIPMAITCLFIKKTLPPE